MTKLVGAAGILMVLALLFGVNFYLARRLWQGLQFIFPRVRFGWVLGIFLFLAIVMLLGFARSFLPLPSAGKHVLGAVGLCWMGVFLYLLLMVVLSDLVVLLLGLCRAVAFPISARVRFVAGLSAVVLALGISGYGFVHARQIKHVTYTVTLSGKEDLSDLKLVLISDLHLGALGSESRLDKIVQEINALQPDVICIAGDFFDSDFHSIRNPEKAAAALQKLSATYGVYACMGNHDAGSTHQDMLTFLEQCGIRTLLDEAVIINDHFVLAGRLDSSPIGSFDGTRKELSSFLPETDLPVIVMDHNPGNMGTYTHEADLILSGHTHKGQLFPVGLITDAMFEEDHGYYRRDENSPHVIITSGIGYWGMPMRVGTDSEIVSITLRSEQ